MKRIGGILAPVTTPFDMLDGDVDIGALRANMSSHLKAGLNGIVLCGSTGEAALLSDEERVAMIITSLGSPKEAIRRMHEVGGKVFCDVTTLPYAKKVEEMGADGVIAVSAGAGGHAGEKPRLFRGPF